MREIGNGYPPAKLARRKPETPMAEIIRRMRIREVPLIRLVPAAASGGPAAALNEYRPNTTVRRQRLAETAAMKRELKVNSAQR
jgi:hypothetical protein